MFRKDNFVYGCIIGLMGPVLGMLLLKFYKFPGTPFSEVLHFIFIEQPSHQVLTAGLTVSLMVNAFLFTMYINGKRDKTAKGLFITTVIYGVVILLLKYLS